jgi:plastocyanin domain-containing protein
MTRVLAAVVLGLALLVAVPVTASAVDEIPLTIENNRFSPEEIKVKANAPFVLVVTNKDKTPEEFESKELRIEKVVPAGQTLKIRVRALKPGTYPFVGDFHQQTAKGRIVAE